MAMQNLTYRQITKIKKVLGGGNIKLLKTPIEYHQLLLHWNFDDEIEPLEYIVDQPETDLGTVVLLYWLLGPGSTFKLRKNNPRLFALTQKIEKNVTAGFYQNKNISIDPTNSEGTDFIAEEANQKYLDEIPEIFKNPTPGENVETTKLVAEYISRVYPLNEADLIKLSKNIDVGLKILLKTDSKIRRDSKPEEILTVLDKYCLSKHPEDWSKHKFGRQDLYEFRKLEFVFGEQIVRRGGFQWYIHELHEMVLDYRAFVLISNDHKYEWNPMSVFLKDLIKYGWHGQTPTSNIASAYADIGAFKESSIRDKLEFHREENEEYADKPDDELVQILMQKRIDEYRQYPHYAEEFKGVSDAEMIKSLQSDLNNGIFGDTLPHGIADFEIFRERHEFTALPE